MFQRRTYLIDSPSAGNEPIFLGRGIFGIMDQRDAELACHFADPRFKLVSVSTLFLLNNEIDNCLHLPERRLG
jgi:hypothetical protein